MTIAVITTFPNNMFEVYGKQMIESFVRNWPNEIPLLIALDDDLLYSQIEKMIRPQDAIAVGWGKDHADFVERNKGKDDPNNYRKQAVRFCHKVFAIERALKATQEAKANNEPCARYLIWLDADVITNRPVTMAEIKECLPKEGDAVAYLGRKDWPHSECGWLAFDLENDGGKSIEEMVRFYTSDAIFNEKEWHDSWIWDRVIEVMQCGTNLTFDKPGMDIWPHSPMGKWSTHFKGPAAKTKMIEQPLKPMPGSNVVIQTKNAIPDEQIRAHIEENQKLIKNWIQECLPTDEQIVVVSAGPQLIAEEVLPDYNAGKKIVAVKHAFERLKAVGIKPWACMLLDPRPHVYDFVKDPDKDAIWFVASQVDPKVTMKLLASGCNVWGYHASVGAGEDALTSLQAQSVISGGSATATRGLFVLKHLGFRRIKLFGYDLCFPDKPDLNAKDNMGQPKYLEMSVGWNHPQASAKKMFYSEPQLIAQFEEFNRLIEGNTFEFEAVGDGMIPFVLKYKALGDLRGGKLKAKLEPKTYGEMLWTNTKKTKFLTKLRRILR
jgi:hypothetical protein